MKLGKLQEVDIRTVWPHEQYDFSKWLSGEENIKELGDILNLSLTDVETEKFVGNYRCDILCKDEITGKVVLIENQLEPTNHDHLGKIITYASGLDAAVVVWIVASARDEHASAIEWLNKHTSDELSFFLLEVHAYKIGDSDPAPYFKIIEQPNDFVKTVKAITQSAELNESQKSRLEFWTQFNEVIDSKGKPFNKRKATTDHWYSVAIGSSEACISIDLVNKEHKIRVGLWITDNKELFDALFQQKNEIEKSLGIELDWRRLDNKKASGICTYITGLDFRNQDNYLHLSEGQKQLCILARTLVADAKLLLLDEPESARDVRCRHRMLQIIRNWTREDTRCAVVTLHDPALALNFCDTLLLLEGGQCIGTLRPGKDSCEQMAAMLSRLYGSVTLTTCRGRSGKEHIVMLKEEEGWT